VINGHLNGLLTCLNTQFMGFASSFDEHKSEIQLALQINVAVTVQSVNAKIDTPLPVLFHQQTGKERALTIAVDARGGKEKCLENPAMLAELIEITEPTSPHKSGPSGQLKTAETKAKAGQLKSKAGEVKKGPDSKKSVLGPSIFFALHAELDTLLEENRAHFELTIAAQAERLARNLTQPIEIRVIAAFHDGSYTRIKDPVSFFHYLLHFVR